MRLVLLLALPLLASCGVSGSCEFWTDTSYSCWQDEWPEACDGGAGQRYFDGATCDDLGYPYRCTKDELGLNALEDKWTAGPGCDTSVPPIGRTPGSGGEDEVLASCTDSFGICSEITSGDAAAFQAECGSQGNTPSSSPCSPGAYQCVGGSGTSSGSPVGLNIHWPSGICGDANFNDVIYLKGTCGTLAGSYSGDGTACCSASTIPAAGGAYCEP